MILRLYDLFQEDRRSEATASDVAFIIALVNLIGPLLYFFIAATTRAAWRPKAGFGAGDGSIAGILATWPALRRRGAAW